MKSFKAKSLTISLIGSEHSYSVFSNDLHRNDNIISKIDFELLDLTPANNNTKTGKYEFPFTIKTNENISPSFLVYN